MQRKRLCRQGLIIFIALVALFFASFNFVNAKEKIDFFYNEDLQEFLSRSYILEHEEYIIPFRVKNFLSWNVKLVENQNYSSEIENIHRCSEVIRGISSCNLLKTLSEQMNVKKSATVFVHPEKIEKYLMEFKDKIKKDPKNGRVRMNSGGSLEVIEKSQLGFAINIRASIKSILDSIKKKSDKLSIVLTVDPVEPELSIKKIRKLKLNDLIGTGESNFFGSPKNRVHNIYNAAKKFEGVLLKADEEFSFVKLLGAVNESTGYRKELVIKEGKTIPEFGGGICQVSTTMFRAALNAGMKIVERQAHAYPVQYYAPSGTDATIYIPKPDFRFINNTSSYILVQPSFIGKNKLKIDIYGLADGRKVEVAKPRHMGYTKDGKQRILLQQVVKDRLDEVIIDKEFWSIYDDPANYH